MFGKNKDKEKEAPIARDYLEIMHGFKTHFNKSLKDLVTADNKRLFTQMESYQYDVLNAASAGDRHQKLISDVNSFGLTDKIARAIDKAIGLSIRDEDELDRFITGLVTSLRLTASEQSDLKNRFRKRPALIWCRLMELRAP